MHPDAAADSGAMDDSISSLLLEVGPMPASLTAVWKTTMPSRGTPNSCDAPFLNEAHDLGQHGVAAGIDHAVQLHLVAHLEPADVRGL